MSRPSYRSILALYLFPLAEMPLIDDHPGSGQLCTQVLLTQFGILRSLRWRKLHPLYFSTTVLPIVQKSQRNLAWGKRNKCSDEIQQRMRDAMFWVGVVCDTSRSLINQVPMVLLGEHGDAKVWEFILQRTVIFDQSFRSHRSQDPLPPDLIVVILEHATACKTMYLGIINQFCDALLHHNIEAMEKGAELIRLESRRFRDIFDPLLSMCGNEYLTLGPENQFNYGTWNFRIFNDSKALIRLVLLVTHYNLESLILADVLEFFEHIPEPLTDPIFSRSRACHSIVNAMNLALNCDRYSHDESPYGSRLLHDPTPEYMVEVLSRSGKAIISCRSNREIASHTAQVMLSVICTSLNVLCHISQTASFALSSFESIGAASGLRVKSEECSKAMKAKDEHIATLSMCNSTFADEFSREMQVQAILGPSNLAAGQSSKDYISED